MSSHQTISKRFDTPESSIDTSSTNASSTGSREWPLKKFSSDNQSHRNLVVLGWRFLFTFFSIFLLAICLWQFSKSQSLSKWEQRSFNMLSILFSGSASLGLGSLLGYLGSMFRWPLLARTMHQMQDVDSILELLDSVSNGLREYAKIPEWFTDYSREDPEFGDNSSYSLSGLEISNSTLQVGTSAVIYSYQLKDFQEGYTILSNRTIHSVASYSLVEVKQDQYWRWDSWDRTGPFNWGSRGDPDDVVSGVLWVSNTSRSESIATGNGSAFPNYWVSPLNFYDQAPTRKSSQIYIVCENLAWECSPTLTETTTPESYQIELHERLFHPTSLYWLFGLGEDLGPYVQTTLGEYAFYVDEPGSRTFTPAALDGLERICLQNFTMPLNETRWNSYTLWVSGLVARLPILAITYANTELPRYTRDTHSNKTAGTAYLHTKLEVNWHRVTLIAVCIIIGQILVIIAVLYYCNGIYTRDDSHLAAAELLKTVVTRFDDGKLMTGEELAESLDDVLGVPVSYGTRKGQVDGPPEVDLASGLDTNFPPFPRKQQFRRILVEKIPKLR
ncbi:hypothetical protein B9Z19DRAFT_1060706 [Tuber borchii]|uniref:Uncharacterized protein n=1 Tax=Tuber borchii TaxID=42251 RepID=A0A2T7A7S0_TUBBO|nr:hypothetical protein B9Z19DRAFT_1060706 [Tuber borchii]